MHKPIEITLQKPALNLLGERSQTITLHPPTGLDVLQCGYPYISSVETRAGKRVEVEIVDFSAVRLLIARCARLPDKSVDDMEAIDIYRLVEMVKIFFQFTGAVTLPNDSSAPASGVATKASSGT